MARLQHTDIPNTGFHREHTPPHRPALWWHSRSHIQWRLAVSQAASPFVTRGWRVPSPFPSSAHWACLARPWLINGWRCGYGCGSCCGSEIGSGSGPTWRGSCCGCGCGSCCGSWTCWPWGSGCGTWAAKKRPRGAFDCRQSCISWLRVERNRLLWGRRGGSQRESVPQLATVAGTCPGTFEPTNIPDTVQNHTTDPCAR